VARVARSQLAMSDEEADAFLASHRWARVGTVSPGGEPTVSPVGYAVVDGRLYFYAMRRARRTSDVEAGSRVAMCVDDGLAAGEGYRDRRGVIVYGTCRIVGDDEEALLETVRRVYAEALFGDPEQDFRRRTHVWFEVRPYRRSSWDFAKIPAGSDRFA
jgi:nitroimidazol reductase NimA-like FMN-containing flavoprotein (pyridoxamine 5'-phosphate oxidase superfamily)